MSDAADAASDLITSLHSGPVDWVGNAWGGHIGIELAAVHPGQIRSLVAISSPTDPNSAALIRQIRMLIPIFRLLGPVRPIRGAIMQGLLTDASRHDRQLVRIVSDGISHSARSSYINSIHSFVLNRSDISELLPRITCPALFITGDDRAEWSPEKLAAAAALTVGASTAVIHGARTLVPLEQPEATANLILEFWSDQPGLHK